MSVRRVRSFLPVVALFACAATSRWVDAEPLPASCGASWYAAGHIATGIQPECMAVADFNGDGKPDLAVASGSGGVPGIRASLMVALGGGSPSGDAYFTPTWSWAFESAPTAVVAADVDGDGVLDLVVPAVGIFRGIKVGDHGTGTFLPPVFVSANSSAGLGVNAVDLVAEDFNGDGSLDIAVLDGNCYGGRVILLLARPFSLFAEPRFLPPVDYMLGCNPTAMTAGDFNGDGHMDLAACTGGTEIYTLLGNGDGSFDVKRIVKGSGDLVLSAIESADLDHDGAQDLIVGFGGFGAPGSGLGCLWGNLDGGRPNGTFTPTAIFILGSSAALALGDVNGDGKLDIFAGGQGSGGRALLWTTGREFVQEQIPTAWTDFDVALLADLDADGRSDLVVNRTESGFASWALRGCRPPAPVIPTGGDWAANGVAIALDGRSHRSPAVLPDGQGGAVVQWLAEENGTNGVARLQRLNSDGARIWGESGRAICEVPARHLTAEVIADGSGGYYVSWVDDRSGAFRHYVKRLGPDGLTRAPWPECGIPVGAFPAASGSRAVVPARLVAAEGGGVWATTLEYTPLSDPRVYRFDADGSAMPGWPTDGVSLGREPVALPGVLAWNRHADLRIAANAVGGIHATTLHDERRCLHFTDCYPSWRMNVRTVTPMATTERPVSDVSLSLYTELSLTALSGGRAIQTHTLEWRGLQALMLGGSGLPEWSAPMGPGAASIPPRVCPDGAGGAFVVWDSPGVVGQDLHATRLAPNGDRAPGWPTVSRTLCAETGFQGAPALTADGIGGFVVAWRDERSGDPDIFVLAVDEYGEPRPGWPAAGLPLVVAPGAQTGPQIALADPGHVVVVWLDGRSGTRKVFAQRVSLEAAPLATDPVAPEDDLSGRRPGYRSPLDVAAGRAFAGRPSDLELEPPGLLASGPNFRIAFSLASAEPARIEVFDPAGRRCARREIGGLGAGAHEVSLATDSPLAPGLYLVRLTQGSRSVVGRGVVLR